MNNHQYSLDNTWIQCRGNKKLMIITEKFLFHNQIHKKLFNDKGVMIMPFNIHKINIFNKPAFLITELNILKDHKDKCLKKVIGDNNQVDYLNKNKVNNQNNILNNLIINNNNIINNILNNKIINQDKVIIFKQINKVNNQFQIDINKNNKLHINQAKEILEENNLHNLAKEILEENSLNNHKYKNLN